MRSSHSEELIGLAAKWPCDSLVLIDRDWLRYERGLLPLAEGFIGTSRGVSFTLLPHEYCGGWFVEWTMRYLDECIGGISTRMHYDRAVETLHVELGGSE